MKIPASIRRLYDDQKAVNDRLKDAIDKRISGFKNHRWHYESRVKELPSFALKIESGRFNNPQALEDFFACTIVVANSSEIAEAERLVGEAFTIKERRPQSHDQTHKASDAFPFDDLRLYVHIADRVSEPPSDLIGIVFEVQVKTFLQHAWAIATHDLLYKSDDANWSKERLAYQIKAMLEHAEMSIQEADALASSIALAKEDRRTKTIKNGIALMKAQWGPDELPSDVRRLARNVTTLLEALKLKVSQLEQILDNAKATTGGAHPSNLSPFATVVQYLFNAEKDKMVALLQATSSRNKILLPPEITLPAGVDAAQLKNAVLVPQPAP